MQICYEGDAARRVLALRAKPDQQVRAALALTREECVDPALTPAARRKQDEWRAEVLERAETVHLPVYLRNRLHMRRASVWASLAFERTRSTQAAPEAAATAAKRAIDELAGIDKAEVTDDDLAAYNDAAMRVNASRWAAMPAAPIAANRKPSIVVTAGQPGETCIALTDDKHDAPLAKRCTYGVVWSASATLNREGNALAVAVQQTGTWRELWVFRKSAGAWTVSVMPPATSTPDIGYAEFAGWVPGGSQMLVAREARSEGKYKRNFEIVRLSDFAVERQSADPSILGAFQRWQDASWKRHTVSVR
jgi:hypothetical protein